MPTSTVVQPVVTALATASFVSEGSAIPASSATWTGANIVAEKIGCIVPIARETFEDSSFDLAGEVLPIVAGAIAKTVDAAIFHGTNKPASWTASCIVDGASGASNMVDLSEIVAANTGPVELENIPAVCSHQKGCTYPNSWQPNPAPLRWGK